MRIWQSAFIFAATLAAASQATAGVVAVSYQASGSAGNWTLNFSVSNNISGAPDQALYLFGVQLSAPGVVSSPAGYDPTAFTTWTNSGLGGSGTLYNNIWLDASTSKLLPGSSLSGFDVKIADLAIPGSVPWFALTIGSSPYTGGGSFGDPLNPGFEGVANLVPEPASGMALAGALAGLLLLRRRWQSIP